MIKLNDLKQGNIISVKYDDIVREGVVTNVSHEMGQAQVDNGIQEFWYDTTELIPILLDEAQLLNLGFTAEPFENGTKYKKDSFRLVTPEKGNFRDVHMWWREDRRHFSVPLYVHQLQNLYADMSKAHLEKV